MMMIMLPITVILVGIVTDVSDVHDLKALSPNNRVSIITGNDDDDDDDDYGTDCSDTSRNSNRR